MGRVAGVLLLVLRVSHHVHAFDAGALVGSFSLGGFLGWAFQGVGPAPSSQAALKVGPAFPVQELKGPCIRIGYGPPKVALYAGAKV